MTTLHSRDLSNRQRSPHWRHASTVAAAAALVAGSATGQTTSAEGGIEQITVTARKVVEKLQDVPVTVTAFSAGDIEKANLVKITDLNNLTPGMNFQDGTGRGGPGRFFIRGLTGGVAGTTRASIFLDGVYVANSTSNILFGELERVEVLLGPQSAQFGRATFGGALSYITKSPGNAFSGNVAIGVATLGERNVDAFVGFPLIQDKLFASVYLGYQKFGGVSRWRNPPDVLHPNGVDRGGTETKSGSFKVLWRVTDDIQLTYRHSEARDHDQPTLSYFLTPNQRNGIYTQRRTTCVGTACTAGAAIPAYYFTGTLNFDYKRGFPNTTLNLDQEPDPDYYNRTARNTLISEWDIFAHSLKLTLSDNRERTGHGFFSDSDFGTFPASRFTPNASSISDRSAELRLDSAQENQFRYSLGAYYLSTHTTGTSKSIGDYFCNNICTPNSPAAVFNTAVLTDWSGSIGGQLNRFVSDFNTVGGVRNISAFVGLFYDFSKQWSASLEGRQQKERVLNVNVSNPAAPIGGAVEFKKFLPRATLQFKPTADSQIYAIYSEGNNPGGLNTAVQIGRPGTGTSESQRTIKEEELLNYELGFKSVWLNNRLKINGSIFRMDWKNLQNTSTYFDPASTFFSVTENRGLARIDGFGVEGEWIATKSLTLRGNFGYQNGRYLKFCSVQYANLLYGPAPASPNSLQGGDPQCLADFNTRSVNVAGKKTETAPPKSGSLNFDYHDTMMGNIKWALRGGVQYTDGMWESEMNLAKSPKAVLYNIGVEFQQGNWTLTADCRNCSDEDAPVRTTRLTDPSATSAASTAGGLGYNQTIGNTLRRPRQLGMAVRYKF